MGSIPNTTSCPSYDENLQFSVDPNLDQKNFDGEWSKIELDLDPSPTSNEGVFFNNAELQLKSENTM